MANRVIIVKCEHVTDSELDKIASRLSNIDEFTDDHFVIISNNLDFLTKKDVMDLFGQMLKVLQDE